ncbi:MAG TPA: pyruvate formate lyase family protein [Armatimonadota bacterium]|nr:pyruvate formate lyase family protein [Armatimonadota bacterium]
MLTMDNDVLHTGEWAITTEEAVCLTARGEYFAAGFLLGQEQSISMRYANGVAEYLTHCPLLPYHGELLYPAGGSIWTTNLTERGPVFDLRSFYVALDNVMNPTIAEKYATEATSPVEQSAYEKIAKFCQLYPKGGGWTHSIVNFGRVLREGLDYYRLRIQRQLTQARNEDTQEFYRALLVIIQAIDTYRQRVGEYLAGFLFTEATAENNRLRLVQAYQDRLAMHPAHNFFAAMLTTIFIYAIDGSDDLGRFDQFMLPYYQESIYRGETDAEEALQLIRTLWRYVDDCHGWNVALAGSTPDGDEASNALTILCLRAAEGRRRPNLAIRLRHDTPQPVWDAVIDTLATGTGLPALYCEENYRHAMDEAQLNLAERDKLNFAFGGCTELMVHGCSNVGSLDADYSVIAQLEKSLYRHLPNSTTFQEFYTAFVDDLRTGIAACTETINRHQETRAKYQPQLIRSLLIDDCIDRGKDFYAGGARYNWSVVNIVGLSNAIDALAAVQQVVFTERSVSAADLLAALQRNFYGDDGLLLRLQRCPHFGNDNAIVDELATKLSGMVFTEFKRYAPWRGGKFLPGTLMFVTYGAFGRPVGATPDGRRAGTPVSDSAGPVQGRDQKGPTAMLRSVAALQQQHAPGTLVVNLRLAKDLFGNQEGRAKIISLVKSYFALGGMQLQVNVVDQAVLRDAIAHPEHHGDLIVRVGGYSEYFNVLDESVKLAMLERTEHR